MKKVALYARVSTNRQTCENQLLELRQIAVRNGWTITAEYFDEGVSGVTREDDRPALAALLKAARQRKFDLLVCWSIDRLGRSLQHLVDLLNQFESLKIDLFFLQQGIDTSTAAGKLFFSIFGALSEYERSLIRERVLAGQERARQRGIKVGRPTKLNDGLRAAITLLRENGMPIKKIARELSVGVGTIYKTLDSSAS